MLDSGPLANNSIILTNNLGQMSSIQCISGSNLPDLGSIASPTGLILDNDNDIFEVRIGDEDDPGFIQLDLKSGRSISFSHQGIYTCTIPDENGNYASLHFGLYLPAFASRHNLSDVFFFFFSS